LGLLLTTEEKSFTYFLESKIRHSSIWWLRYQSLISNIFLSQQTHTKLEQC